MNERTIQKGREVRLNGRDYIVESEIPVGPETAKACPWVKGQWGVRGRRGAVALLTVNSNWTWTLQFITSSGSRIEKGSL